MLARPLLSRLRRPPQLSLGPGLKLPRLLPSPPLAPHPALAAQWTPDEKALMSGEVGAAYFLPNQKSFPWPAMWDPSGTKHGRVEMLAKLVNAWCAWG